jgi:hypothetical protein
MVFMFTVIDIKVAIDFSVINHYQCEMNNSFIARINNLRIVNWCLLHSMVKVSHLALIIFF